MAYFQYAVACAFVIFLCVQQGYSLNCFQCNSHNDTSCMTSVPPDSFKKPCNSSHIMCRKIKQVIDFEVNGLQPETRIIRSCGTYNASLTNHCYQRSGFGGRQEVCSCDKDYCNTSTSLIATPTLLLAFYALLKICH